MRTNRINRFLAACLTMLMLVGMAGTALPTASALALPASDWKEGVIAVTFNAGETEGDKVIVKAYKLISVNTDALLGTDPKEYQPADPEYTWEQGIAGWVRTNYPAYIGPDDPVQGTDNSVQEAFSKITDAQAAAFYAAVEAVIMEGNVTMDATTRPVAGNITGLTMGVYLITATGGTSVYRPHVAQITPVSNGASWEITQPTKVTLKSSPVSLDKTITSEKKTLGVGDTVSYQLEVDVPTYPDNAVSKTFVISDTLSEGLTLTANTVKVVDQVGNEMTDLLDRITVVGQTLTITLTPDESKANPNPIDGKTKLTVTYDAVLNEKAQLGTEGNQNTATLTYSNDPYVTGPSKTVEDKETVYTYGIQVTKVNKTNSDADKQGLPGAEFELKDENDQVLKFKTVNGAYVKAQDQNDTSANAVLTSGSDGKLIVKGLAPGTYKLKETKAPTGYVLSASEIEVNIVDRDEDGILDEKQKNDPNLKEDNGLVELEVQNTKGFTLPQTGGFGTVLFTMIGIVLMGGGVLLVAVFLKKFFSRAK